jgi:hypothetical protein
MTKGSLSSSGVPGAVGVVGATGVSQLGEQSKILAGFQDALDRRR